ncbi:MAG: endonuclease, partial [Bacteroidaceae bacterium]|nr:endonuclease [Bacteroidaceae bacterium]
MKRHTTLFFLSLLLPMLASAGIPDGYYDAADGKKKAALKAALHNIIQPVTVLSYGSGPNSTWSGFYKTDRTSDNQVIDRYSYDIRYFTSTTDAVSGMNIEHSFPKSWWGGSSTPSAYKDLFNLMPCEKNINSTKSNYAMGKVTGTDKGNGCTKVGTGMAGGKSTSLWEPADEWKGDFARDYFYMVTAYSHLTWTSNGLDMLEQDDWPTLKEWAYTLFLEWAKNDPVDEIERARNDAVYKIQSNRNPF